MTSSDWEHRERVLLEAIGTAEESGRSLDTNGLIAASGLDGPVVNRTLRRLLDGEYIAAMNVGTFGNPDAMMEIRLRERGLREVGEWPPEDQYDSFLQVLQVAIDNAATSDERSKLERLRDGLLGVGRDVGTSLLVGWARQAVGLP